MALNIYGINVRSYIEDKFLKFCKLTFLPLAHQCDNFVSWS